MTLGWGSGLLRQALTGSWTSSDLQEGHGRVQCLSAQVMQAWRHGRSDAAITLQGQAHCQIMSLKVQVQVQGKGAGAG